jgi:AcrR family transcriptional regulator
MAQLTPQDRRRAQTRRDILDNAHQMLIAHGLEGISIRALADRIDYTPGALYKYFPSKEALIDTVRAGCVTHGSTLLFFPACRPRRHPAQMLLNGAVGLHCLCA